MKQAFKFILDSGPKYPGSPFSSSHVSFFSSKSVCVQYLMCVGLLVFIISIRKQEKKSHDKM